MNRLIAISGKIGSGKDETGRFIQEQLSQRGEEWHIKKFATKLKQCLALALEVDLSVFESREFKDSFLPQEWNGPNGESTSIRKLMQTFGTDAVRSVVHEDFWVNSLFAGWNEKSRWIITDLRFPNEYERVKKMGGITVRINRPLELSSSHPSETALDNFSFDWTIDNRADLEQLKREVYLFTSSL